MHCCIILGANFLFKAHDVIKAANCEWPGRNKLFSLGMRLDNYILIAPLIGFCFVAMSHGAYYVVTENERNGLVDRA